MALASSVIGMLEVLLAIGVPGRATAATFAQHVALEIGALEHRFDHDIAGGDPLIGGGRADAPDHIGIGAAAQTPALGIALRALGDGLPALQRDIVRHVDQIDLHPGLRRNIGDAAPHHAAADHRDSRGLRRRHVLRPHLHRLGVGRADEQRADLRLGVGRGREPREIARLDRDPGIEAAFEAVMQHLQDRFAGEIATGAALVQARPASHEEHAAFGGLRGEARQLVALHVPGLRRIRIGERPGLRRRAQLFRRHHRIDDACGERVGRLQPLAFQQQRRRRRNPDQPRQPLRAAAARHQAERDFRQAEARGRHIGRDPAMTGERQFEAAAERGAVQRRDHRLAAGLELAQRFQERRHDRDRVGRRLRRGATGRDRRRRGNRAWRR